MSKSTDRITYTWNNINVWTGTPGGTKDVGDGEGDVESAPGCCKKLKKKKGKAVKSKQILNNGQQVSSLNSELHLKSNEGWPND
jgi:hypothetical protein